MRLLAHDLAKMMLDVYVPGLIQFNYAPFDIFNKVN